MKIVFLIARTLLGIMFAVFGANAFFSFLPMILPPGDAGQFLAFYFGRITSGSSVASNSSRAFSCS